MEHSRPRLCIVSATSASSAVKFQGLAFNYRYYSIQTSHARHIIQKTSRLSPVFLSPAFLSPAFPRFSFR